MTLLNRCSVPTTFAEAAILTSVLPGFGSSGEGERPEVLFPFLSSLWNTALGSKCFIIWSSGTSGKFGTNLFLIINSMAYTDSIASRASRFLRNKEGKASGREPVEERDPAGGCERAWKRGGGGAGGGNE